VGPVLELGLLGPFEVRIDDGEPVALGGVRQRALLAVLGLHANQVVSTDRLIDELWGEHPPSTALHTVQVFVSRLRGALGPAGERLLTRPPGYVLELGADELDAGRCKRLYDSGRSALGAGDAAGAAALLQAAQALWRGPPLAEFTYEPFAQATIARLEELRLSCREEIIEAELALGRHAEVVSELESLVREQPLRERPRGQLMLALYRSGRQAEALEAFQQARRMLVDELALDPSPALQELEQRILRQDPSLDAREAQPEVVQVPTAEAEPPVPEMSAVADDAGPGALLRKTVTVLVVRLELAVRADPEVSRARISIGRDDAEQIIGHHGGMVVSRMGGEVIGVYGVPATREDDALRALRSAQELLSRIAELGAPGPGALLARAFVDTGEVVGEASGDVSGEPVSIARELVHVADKFEVLLSDATRRVVSGSIQVESALDGSAWRLLGLVADAPVLRASEPMVDRYAELATARTAFDQTLRGRNAHLLTVLGEAGIGKSRLAQELLNELGASATVLIGRCLSYGEGIAFWPLREALTQAAGGESRDAIRALLDGADEADAVADIVASVLGLAPAESAGEQVPWAFRRLLEAMAGERPVILVLEDIHWGEAPLLDLVEYLIDWLTVPVLLVCLARPELLDNRPGWAGGHQRVSSLLLSPLEEADARLMLDQHLGDRRLTAAESAEILEIAEGNPLFVEQLLRTSAEDPMWDRERQVPATIQSLLASRLDRLGPGERAYTERAAVIGREFWPDAIVALLPAEARASAAGHLRALVHRGLIHPDRSTLAGQEQLRFHHILIRDVAYHTTPKALRAQLHERFADWLARRDEQYDEFIGFHLEQAFRLRSEVLGPDTDAKAIAVRAGDHLAGAGRRAAVRGDANAAVSLLRRAAELFEAGDRPRPDVLLDLGVALSEESELSEAERVMNAALEQAGAIKAEAIGARVLIELAALRAQMDPNARVEEIQAVAERAMTVFERLGDEAGLSRALIQVSDVHWTRCCFGEMEPVLEEALAHAERADVPGERARILRYLAQAVVLGPRPVDDAIERCNAILERVIDDDRSAAFTQAMLAVLEAMHGRFDEARSLWRKSQQRLRDVGMNIRASTQQVYRGFIELMCETPVDVTPDLAEACGLLQRIGERNRLSTVAALQARLLYAQGRYEESEDYARVSADAAATDDAVSQVITRGTRGKLLARRGERELADELSASAVAIAAETDFLVIHGDSLRDRAEVLTILNRPEEAAEQVELAIALYERKDARVSADAARRLKSSLHEYVTGVRSS
jgi:DNA-binding SARP family transcriptional activator